MSLSYSPTSSPYPAPSDEEFNLQLMNIPDDIDATGNENSNSFELDDSMLAMDDMNPEELSTWLEEELDEDEVKLFENGSNGSITEESDDENSKSRGHSRSESERYLELTLDRTQSDYTQVRDGPSEHMHTSAQSLPSSHTKVAFTDDSGNSIDPGEYNSALSNLALSMRRTELSRAEILRQRHSMSNVQQDEVSNTVTSSSFPCPIGQSNTISHVPQTNSVMKHSYASTINSNTSYQIPQSTPVTQQEYSHIVRKRHTISHTSEFTNNLSAQPTLQPSTVHGFAGLLNGNRTSLTVGLEQSRKRLREYMFRMNNNSF